MVINLLKSFIIGLPIFGFIFSLRLLISKAISLGDKLITVNVLTEWRICQNYIKSFLKYTVDIEQTIVMMYTAVTITVHNHIHFGRSSHTRICVRSINTIPGELIHSSSFDRCIEFGIQCRLHLINFVADFYLFFFRLSVKVISFKRCSQFFFL